MQLNYVINILILLSLFSSLLLVYLNHIKVLKIIIKLQYLYMCCFLRLLQLIQTKIEKEDCP